MASVIYDSKINHRKKLIHIFTPKCAGCAISKWIHALDPKDEWEPFPQLRHVMPKGYTSFAIVRNPIDWVLSGYKMYKSHHNLPFDFEKHCEMINNPISLLRKQHEKINIVWEQYWWHCGITPDQHLADDTKAFKLENIEILRTWMTKYYPNALDIDMIVDNASPPYEVIDVEYNVKEQGLHKIYITKRAKDLIQRKCSYYAKRYGYEL